MYNYDISVLGRAIVIHAPDNTRIGCGIIGTNEQITYQGSRLWLPLSLRQFLAP